MQVSIKWLKDYIDFKETPEQIADKLTMAGVPVENIKDMGAGLEKVITGKIVQIEKHPNADKLSICTLDVGQAETIIIVTGATNVREGQIVPVAMIGAKLPNGLKISKGKLRGVASFGMLCSAAELNLDLDSLSDDAKSGIYILPKDTSVGIQVKDVLGLNDVILEFELTANRADCFSVLGIVREIAVLTGNSVKKPMLRLQEDGDKKANELISVKIEANNLCSRFSARVLQNVKVGKSPAWIKERIEAAGVRSINNVVDVTNFVMLEFGQPMHAYDYDMLAGHVLIARQANQGEKLTTLDNVKRELNPSMLVIADSVQPAGLGGVMGGLASEVTESTKTVVLEAAVFNGANIRRTARACGLHSEASGRFERGVDVINTVKALDRAAQLLEEMGACTVCPEIVDAYPGFELPSQVKFTSTQVNKHLGTTISSQVMVDILKRLEFEISSVKGEEITVTVPSWRNDVRCMSDIAEEISRIYGFNRIASTLPDGSMMQGGQSEEQSFVDRVKDILVAAGMNEIISFSFTHPQTFDKLNIPVDSQLRQAVEIMNPITDEFPLLRTTAVSSVLETIARNLSRKNEDLKIFEIGSVFTPKALPLTELPIEKLMLCGALTGKRTDIAWNQGKDTVDFYDAKGVIEVLFERLGIQKYTVQAGEHYAMHPGKTALFMKGKEIIAYVGEVHPQVQAQMNITKKTYLFEMDIEKLMKYSALTCRYQSLPKYPAMSRDLALVVADDITASEVEKMIVKNAGKLLNNICLFDVYMGEQVGKGQKSLAFSLQFQSAEKTLTDAEIDPYFESIIKALEEAFNAKLRS
ncbi:phenylalanine--tRNA ligase subunit beta [Anaerosinus gibii]|uniref:Phenylalanine--tRNA ligase beta subunit n=1 Tax=Selenobaculum gibii TaxID=3054208 RepID=A0A9Y2AKE9_9FIRM|nr:phenylalanine--tRNA ligase subunit beta [Selenobaculum gbiensis]WIW71753.1 phenylalanine--tRNA ligase subunit beta [Selenobaculum gbiensis]